MHYWYKKHPYSSIMLIYDHDHYSQDYGQIKEAFRALPKDHILKPDISDIEFRSSNNGNDIGFILYVFDIRYQRILEGTEPIEVEIKFPENIPSGIYGYALVLTNSLVSIISDGNRLFDLL